MSIDRKITLFSRAIFEIGREHGKLDAFNEKLTEVAEAFRANPEIMDYFADRFFTVEEKKDFLEKLLEDQLLVNSFMVIIEELHNRKVDASSVFNSRIQSYEIDENTPLVGKLFTTEYLSPERVADISELMSKKMNRDVTLRNIIDPTILGGIKVEVEGQL